jgi:hypothetical protein
LAASASRSKKAGGRRYRGLNLLSRSDGLLLQTINQGEYVIAGFRNRDLRALLFGQANEPAARKKHSGQVTRRLQLLRAHGLIQKVPKTHRYKVTGSGRRLASAVSYARESSLNKLSQAA